VLRSRRTNARRTAQNSVEAETPGLEHDDAEQDGGDHQAEANEDESESVAFRWMLHARMLGVLHPEQPWRREVQLVADDALEGEDEAKGELPRIRRKP
jgi:hypothetical protein